MKVRLTVGEKLNRNPNNPILEFIDGEIPYIWIGNDAKNDKFCFATVNVSKMLWLCHKIVDSYKSKKLEKKIKEMLDKNVRR